MDDPSSEPSPAQDDRRERMKRVRIGLTGLAVVLLIVALATLLLSQINQQVVTNPTTAPVDAAKANDEPLADLGVTPGAPENKAEPAPVPAPAPAPVPAPAP